MGSAAAPYILLLRDLLLLHRGLFSLLLIFIMSSAEAAPYNLHLRVLLLLGYALRGGGLYLFEVSRSTYFIRHDPTQQI
jgi:hypothetical protein